MNRISLLTSAFFFSVGFVACTDYQADYASAWEDHPDYVADSGNNTTTEKTSSTSTATQPSTPSNGGSGSGVCTDLSGNSFKVGEKDPTLGCTCNSDGSWGNCVTCKDDKGKSYTVGQAALGCVCTIKGTWDCGLIDDLEDGDMICKTGGKWIAYSDAQDGGSTTFSNKISNGEFSVIFAGSSLNGSSYVAGLSNVKLNAGSYKYDPYAGMVVTLKADETAYDLSSCTTISYDYSGAGHSFRVLMEGDLKGELTKYDYHGYNVAGTAGWSSVAIPMSDLKQKGWGTKVTLVPALIARFGWEIQKTASQNFLYIDNVRCVGAVIK